MKNCFIRKQKNMKLFKEKKILFKLEDRKDKKKRTRKTLLKNIHFYFNEKLCWLKIKLRQDGGELSMKH